MRILPSGHLGIKLKTVLWIATAWTLVGALDAWNVHAMSYSDFITQKPSYSFARYLWVSSLSGLVSGFISGTILVFYLRERLKNKSFGLSLLISGLALSAVNFVISSLVFELFLHFSFSSHLIDPKIMQQAADLLYGILHVKNLVFWSIIVVFTIITLHVNDKYGPGVLLKLLLGRYHQPREEERIFMFVDMKSSTTIAEKLGHIRFFNLLNDFFADITNPIIYTRGEIYQYVGDEVVISWTMKRGISKANCIRCFYGMQESLRKNAAKYYEKYGLLPEFKAGLHSGVVTTGEIGILKKDFVFSGDVMNTTARIQSMCNTYNAKILLSKHLLDQLNLPPHDFRPQRVGIIELKGKMRKVELYTFEESTLAAEQAPLLTTKK